jgi:transcription termination/antitermination protein NusG
VGNLSTSPDYRRLIQESDLAQQRNLSRYGSRESIDDVPKDLGVWFVIRCHGREERLAAAGLSAKHFDVYLPVIWVKERARRGHVREVERPMFSTYLFIRCLPRSDHWERARNVAGVYAFVGEHIPESIPKQALDEVARAEAELATRSGRKSLRWKMDIGDDVMVTEGPFAYFHAKVVSAVDDHGRIEALVNLFGRFTRVTFDADQLEKV